MFKINKNGFSYFESQKTETKTLEKEVLKEEPSKARESTARMVYSREE